MSWFFPPWLTWVYCKNVVSPPGNKISSTNTLRPRRRRSLSWICRMLKCVRRLNTLRARTRNCRSSWRRTKKRCVYLKIVFHYYTQFNYFIWHGVTVCYSAVDVFHSDSVTVDILVFRGTQTHNLSWEDN